MPVIPVVIHNSGDIAPKGDFLFRPGKVRVDILPPVDTADWTLATMNEQVNTVRNQFLRALDQPEQTLAAMQRAKRNQPADMRPELQGSTSKKLTAKKAAAKKAPSRQTGAKKPRVKKSGRQKPRQRPQVKSPAKKMTNSSATSLGETDTDSQEMSH